MYNEQREKWVGALVSARVCMWVDGEGGMPCVCCVRACVVVRERERDTETSRLRQRYKNGQETWRTGEGGGGEGVGGRRERETYDIEAGK